jgi:hypothetical protein
MWKIAMLAVAIGAAAVGQSRAEDEGPWCSHESIGDGTVVERCHFVTFEECRAVAAGLATTFCSQNPRYVAPKNEPGSASTRGTVVSKPR